MPTARSEHVFTNKFKLSSVVLIGTGLITGGTGDTAPMTRPNTGEDDNKFVLLDNTSSGIGEIMAGHNLPVGGSCRCPHELHRRPALLVAAGRQLAAGVCLVLLPVMMGAFCSIFAGLE